MLINWFTMQKNADCIWFTSDTHFGHKNIIKYCERPFPDIETMDEALIEAWNRVIKPDDTVFHLGDFTLGNIQVAEKYFHQLTGRIMVLTNEWHHDKFWINHNKNYEKLPRIAYSSKEYLRSKDGFPVALLPPIVLLEIPWRDRSISISLCHYPLKDWENKYHKAWHLHGHSHNTKISKPDKNNLFRLDVGVDAMHYHPINLKEILELMQAVGWYT